MAEHVSMVNSIVLLARLRQSKAMRMLILLASLLTILTACAPLTIYYKPGASVARLEQETTTCQVSALKDAPVANQIRQNPPIYMPGRVICDSAGYCYQTGGYWIQGRIYTVDVNAGLRRQLTDQCMAAKGFAPERIPQCPAGTASSVEPKAPKNLPELSDTSCAILYKGGAFQILNLK